MKRKKTRNVLLNQISQEHEIRSFGRRIDILIAMVVTQYQILNRFFNRFQRASGKLARRSQYSIRVSKGSNR